MGVVVQDAVAPLVWYWSRFRSAIKMRMTTNNDVRVRVEWDYYSYTERKDT